MKVKLLALLILTAGNYLVWQPIAFADESVSVNILNVGQGDAILIQSGHTQVLVDSGRPDGKVLGELNRLMPYDDRKIETFILTNPDLDHFGGVLSLLKHYKIEAVISSGKESASAEFGDYKEALASTRVPRMTARAGQTIRADDLSFEVLYPFSAKQDENHNDDMLVLKLALRGHTFLLTGDLLAKDESIINGIYGDRLQAEVLKVAHHGSAYSSTSSFLTRVNPKFAVIAVGKNSYGHPTPSALERLKATTKTIWRTDQDGTTRFIIDRSGRMTTAVQMQEAQ